MVQWNLQCGLLLTGGRHNIAEISEDDSMPATTEKQPSAVRVDNGMLNCKITLKSSRDVRTVMSSRVEFLLNRESSWYIDAARLDGARRQHLYSLDTPDHTTHDAVA